MMNIYTEGVRLFYSDSQLPEKLTDKEKKIFKVIIFQILQMQKL